MESVLEVVRSLSGSLMPTLLGGVCAGLRSLRNHGSAGREEMAPMRLPRDCACTPSNIK